MTIPTCRSATRSLPAMLAVLMLATGAENLGAAEPLSKAQLLELAEQGVGEALVLKLVERDCVSFEVTAETLPELAQLLPESVVEAVIDCRLEIERGPKAGGGEETGRASALSTELLKGDLVVLPFSGTSEFRSLAAETLVSEIVTKSKVRVIEPEALNERLVRINEEPGTEGAPIPERRKINAVVEARLAVQGDINAYRRGGTLNAVATLKVIDLNTGEVVAVGQRKSGLLFANSQQQCVVKAVKRAIGDILPVIEEKRAR